MDRKKMKENLLRKLDEVKTNVGEVFDTDEAILELISSTEELKSAIDREVHFRQTYETDIKSMSCTELRDTVCPFENETTYLSL